MDTIKIDKCIGYIWMSDKESPEVFEGEKFNRVLDETKNPFVVEAQLYDTDNCISHSIKYIDGEYIVNKAEVEKSVLTALSGEKKEYKQSDGSVVEKKLYLAYDRIAYLGKDNPEFRITFDYHIRSRTDQLNLENGSSGKLLLQDGDYIMEVKSISGMPLWFSKLLCDLKIYPTSFSKYGEIYQNSLRKKGKNYV